MPSSSAYRSRFNSLVRAYQLVGFTPARDFAYIELNRALRKVYARQCEKLLSEIRNTGASVRQDSSTELFAVNEEFTLSLIVARCHPTHTGSLRWLLRFETSLRPDVTAAIRLEPDNQSVRDCYIFPGTDIFASRLRLARDNGVLIDLYRFDDLRFVVGMAEHISIARVA